MDNAKQFVTGIGLEPQSADPANAVEGDLHYSDGTARTEGVYVFKDAAWVELAAAAGTNPTVVTKTGTYTVLSTDDTIIADATSGAFTLTLPASASNSGKIYNIVKSDSTANVVTIDGNSSETIDGTTTIDLDRQHQSVSIASDGTNWFVISGRHQIDSTVRMNTSNGFGSTNTLIRKWTNSSTVGTAITFDNSATLGGTLTVEEDGVYFVTYTDQFGVGANFGITLNADVTLNILNVPASDILSQENTPSIGQPVSSSWAGALTKGDIVRFQTDSGPTGGTAARSMATMAKIGRL